jgi:short-subunit dehydrogenase
VHGVFLDNPWEKERQMLEVDVTALVHLTKLFLPDMVERGFGRILQVASTAAYQPVPTYAVYGAAKAFVLSFGEALNHELQGTGVTCTVVSPGVTKTEFQAMAGHAYTSYMRRAQMQSPEVTRIGINAMLKGRSSIIPGIHNSLAAWSVRLAPRRTATAIAGIFMRGGGGDSSEG